MAISLQKGGNVNLSKEAPSMAKMVIGLGWNTRATDGSAFDLDASAFLLQESGRVSSDAGFIFYNQKASACGGVIHQGDNTTGEGDGDDEVIKIDPSKLPADIQKVAFAVTIHDADARRQNFGMVSNAYIRILDEANGQEIARYDLSEDASVETAMTFGELYRHNGEWKFKAIGQGFQGGLGPLARNYGVTA
ncbi:TerD family protein [Thermomonas sp.]|uniref:TerD family protein n=1 Tax=Thermomonas sp. TaxID=1971895 RepID=UPI002602890F|nr:TerD family protein [Thermomonas sp.]MBL0228956.1 TerD family protein [Thermomonas sp.]